jgi:hypothetical protein
MLGKPWDPSIEHPKDQPRYQRAESCWLEPVMGSLNSWHLVTITEGQVDDTEVALLHHDARAAREAEVEEAIEKLSFGFVIDGDAHRLVKWIGTPYPLQAATKIDGCGTTAMPEGSMVARCLYWDELPAHPGVDHGGNWFQQPITDLAKNVKPKVRIVWLRNVLIGRVEVLHPPLEAQFVPLDGIFFHACNRKKPMNQALVESLSMKAVDYECHVRRKLDLVLLVKDVPVGLVKKRAAPEENKKKELDKEANKKRKLACFGCVNVQCCLPLF